MANVWQTRWITWPATALLLTACVFPPSLPSLPTAQSSPQTLSAPAQAIAPVLVPTNTPLGDSPATGLTLAQQQLLAGLPTLGTAPELYNEIWLNSAPLQLAALRGKVVMVEFWTFGCINCRNMNPWVQAWHEQYADDGLVIIGVHTPEFAYEQELGNVQAAMAELGVTWPVAIDNDKATWRAYANHYWPAAYLIDKQGQIRLLKIGEGQYDYTERVIQALLAEPG